MKIYDDDLKKSIDEIKNGLIGANLGGHVYKKRIGMDGKGKRSTHRTIILMKIHDKAIFAHGFAKGEKDNITKNERKGFKVMAEAFLNLDNKQITLLVDKQIFIEVL